MAGALTRFDDLNRLKGSCAWLWMADWKYIVRAYGVHSGDWRKDEKDGNRDSNDGDCYSNSVSEVRREEKKCGTTDIYIFRAFQSDLRNELERQRLIII